MRRKDNNYLKIEFKKDKNIEKYILDLIFSEITFSLIHPKFPLFKAVFEMLKVIATFSKPSILILSKKSIYKRRYCSSLTYNY